MSAVGLLAAMAGGFMMRVATVRGGGSSGGPYIKFGLSIFAVTMFARFVAPLLPFPVLNIVAVAILGYSVISLVQR